MPALTLTPSSGEREPAAHAPLFSADRPANPAAGIAQDAAKIFSLSSEERAGVRWSLIQMNVCSTSALTLTLSPGEREPAARAPLFYGRLSGQSRHCGFTAASFSYGMV